MLWMLHADSVSAAPSQRCITESDGMVEWCGHRWRWQLLRVFLPLLLDVQESGTVERRGLTAIIPINSNMWA